MTHLPIPSDDALAHSSKLVKHIQQAITQSGGLISFARFMELALYAPGLGYYSAGSHKLGENGDFITAPEISPLFARCIARQCQQILSELKQGDILEMGAGSGKLGCDLLLELERLQSLPQHYYILEISADLRARQKQRLSQNIPHLLPRIIWLNELPIEKINGVILANEVLDALPASCFRIENNEVKERCVNNHFEWQLSSPQSVELEQAVHQIKKECDLKDGYESEVSLLLPAWINALQNSLKQGLILLFDYGYGRREFYHPDRTNGTLTCYYQHHRHDNPFLLIGLQDITAHVDFTAVAEAAVENGLTVGGYTTQAAFLLSTGILDRGGMPELTAREHYQQNQAVKMLTLPSQMGELIKVIALTKNCDVPLTGFALHDRRQDL